MRTIVMMGLLSACAPNIWNRRQVDCGDLTEVRYTSNGAWPGAVSSAASPDESCELKIDGLRRGSVAVDRSTGVATLEDVENLELEVDPSEQPNVPGLLLMFNAGIEGEPNLITQKSTNELDFSYGALDEVKISAEGLVEVVYEPEPPVGGMAVGSAELTWVGCALRAKMGAGSLEVNVQETDEVDGTTVGNLAGPVTELCVGPDTVEVDVTADANSRVRVVLPSGYGSLENLVFNVPGPLEIIASEALYFDGQPPDTIRVLETQIYPSPGSPMISFAVEPSDVYLPVDAEVSCSF